MEFTGTLVLMWQVVVFLLESALTFVRDMLSAAQAKLKTKKEA